MLKVHIFDSTNPLIADFNSLPERLYKDDPFYIPKENTPPDDLESTYFLVTEKNIIVSRACALINPDISYKNLKTTLVGYYESVDNPQAATILLDAISQYNKEKGYQCLIGPINGTTWHNYRLTDPDNKLPFFFDNYHKNWYVRDFKDNNFQAIASYFSSVVNPGHTEYLRLNRFENYYARRGISIRPLSLSCFEEDLESIYNICIISFQHNFLYTAISQESFLQMYKNVGVFLNYDMSFIAEDKHNRPCGFIFALDNRFEQQKKSLVIKTLAVLPEPQFRGLGTLLTEMTHQKAALSGYEEVIHALMHHNNLSRNILSGQNHIFRSYQLYRRIL